MRSDRFRCVETRARWLGSTRPDCNICVLGDVKLADWVYGRKVRF